MVLTSVSKILLVFEFSTVFRVNNDFERVTERVTSDLLLQKVTDPSESNARPLKL